MSVRLALDLENNMRNLRRATVLTGILAFALSLTAMAETRLANIFGDHMVLQQDKPLTVWGWAEPGAKVTVTLTEDRDDAVEAAGEGALRRERPEPKKSKVESEFKTPKVRLTCVQEDAPAQSTVKQQTTAGAEGRWSVSFDPLKASFTPKFLCVSGDTQSAVIDVLVGEVWVTAGQSNMASGGNRSAWLDNAGLLEPAVRYTVHSNSAPEPLEDLPKRSTWRVCTVEGDGTLTGVSTIAYLFAKNLHRQLKVPVAVINTATGGSLGSEWTGLPELKSIDHPHVKELFATDSKSMPGRNFNGRICPIGRLRVRGALFMQGEQQALTHQIPRYRPIFPKIISAFRRAFGDENLPFGIISLHLQGAPEAEDAMANGYAVVCDIHYRTHLATPGTGYITGHDVSGGLHPIWKRPLAERAVLWALTDVYGAPGISQRERGGQKKYKVEVTFDGDVARVYLMVPGRVRGQDSGWIEKDVPVSMYYPKAYDGLPYRGFALADADGRWYPGRVKRACDVSYVSEKDKQRKKAVYNCLEVSHPLVEKPVALRYAFGDGSAHLGSYYLPVPPLRTDDWTTWEMEEGVKNRPIMHQMQAVAEQDRWDRKSRETVHDAHEADMNLQPTPKHMLRSLADRMTVGLKLVLPDDVFRDDAAALSEEYIGKVSEQYRRPDNLWGKKALWWVKGHRLQTLPDEMHKALKDPKVAAAYAQLQEAVRDFQDAVDALPEAPPLPKEIRPAPLPELDPSYSTETRRQWATKSFGSPTK